MHLRKKIIFLSNIIYQTINIRIFVPNSFYVKKLARFLHIEILKKFILK